MQPFSRRNLLRGAGTVALGLPFLEGLAPKKAKAAPGDGKGRLLILFECNGVDTARFWPNQAGGTLQSSSLTGTAMESLAPFADRLLVPRGVYATPRFTDGTPGDGHMQGIAHKLTAEPIGGSGFANGVSVDQVVASQFNEGGKPALSLRSGPESSGVAAYISYAEAGVPSVGELNPWLAYQDIVGLGGLDELQLERLVARRESVLDLVGGEFDSLMANSKLSQHDRSKLDMHASAIRDLELDMIDGGLVPCEFDASTADSFEQLHQSGLLGYDSYFHFQTEAHVRLMALAVACGATNASTLLLGSGAFGPTYQFDGMNHQYNHHKLSHGNTQDDDTGSTVAGFEDMIHDIDRWTMRQYTLLLELLDGYTEADGTLLDNSMVVYVNELSNGFFHTDSDLPFIVAGSSGGMLKQGEYMEVSPSGEPLTKFWTSILNAAGVTAEDGGPVTQFGNMTYGQPGQLDNLFAT